MSNNLNFEDRDLGVLPINESEDMVQLDPIFENIARELIAREIDPLSDLYHSYMLERASGRNTFISTLNRRKLMKRILKESHGFLNNNMFLTIIQQEADLLENEESKKYFSLDILTMTRVALAVRKGTPLSEEEIRTSLKKEFTVISESSSDSFKTDVIFWIMCLMSGHKEENEVSIKILEYMDSKALTENISEAIHIGMDAVNPMNLRLQEHLDNAPAVVRHRGITHNLIRTCLVMFIVNYTLDDMLTADYFLMKAVSMNYDGGEFESLLYFLEDVILLKN